VLATGGVLALAVASCNEKASPLVQLNVAVSGVDASTIRSGSIIISLPGRGLDTSSSAELRFPQDQSLPASIDIRDADGDGLLDLVLAYNSGYPFRPGFSAAFAPELATTDLGAVDLQIVATLSSTQGGDPLKSAPATVRVETNGTLSMTEVALTIDCADPNDLRCTAAPLTPECADPSDGAQVCRIASCGGALGPFTAVSSLQALPRIVDRSSTVVWLESSPPQSAIPELRSAVVLPDGTVRAGDVAPVQGAVARSLQFVRLTPSGRAAGFIFERGAVLRGVSTERGGNSPMGVLSGSLAVAMAAPDLAVVPLPNDKVFVAWADGPDTASGRYNIKGAIVTFDFAANTATFTPEPGSILTIASNEFPEGGPNSSIVASERTVFQIDAALISAGNAPGAAEVIGIALTEVIDPAGFNSRLGGTTTAATTTGTTITTFDPTPVPHTFYVRYDRQSALSTPGGATHPMRLLSAGKDVVETLPRLLPATGAPAEIFVAWRAEGPSSANPRLNGLVGGRVSNASTFVDVNGAPAGQSPQVLLSFGTEATVGQLVLVPDGGTGGYRALQHISLNATETPVDVLLRLDTKGQPIGGRDDFYSGETCGPVALAPPAAAAPGAAVLLVRQRCGNLRFGDADRLYCPSPAVPLHLKVQ
jgi:hypothetical protein